MDHARSKPKSLSIRRRALWSAIVVVLFAGGVALANIDFSTKRVQRSKISIDTVRRGTLDIKVSANGQLLPRNIEYIASEVVGRVAKSYVKAGAVVTVGQPLVDLSNPQLLDSAQEAESAWQGAVTDMQASKADLETLLLNQQLALTRADYDLQRAVLQLAADKKLIKEHIIAEIDYERSGLSVDQLTRTRDIEASRLEKMRDNIKVQQAVKQSRVTELAQALDRAKHQVAALRIAAGISGIVQEVGIDVGQQLQPGSPIGRIAQLDQLYAELKVPAREATDVQIGQSAVIDTHSGMAKGIVKRVDPAVTDGTVIVDVDLKDALPAGARPQLPVEGVIYISQLNDALFVGKPAYVKANSDLTVYKLDSDGRYASRTTIKTGKISVNAMQVLSGLDGGDHIITSDMGEWQDRDRILIN